MNHVTTNRSAAMTITVHEVRDTLSDGSVAMSVRITYDEQHVDIPVRSDSGFMFRSASDIREVLNDLGVTEAEFGDDVDLNCGCAV